MKAKEVREQYLNFFKEKGHTVIPSASLIPENDPTTLFTSSGMQPLVPYLMGEKHPAGKRIVDSQLSIRLQDIEEVGDLSHTTFFEMLGNWSLGDYFKKEQLRWFWEFVTEVLKLPKERLWVSVFEGNDEVPKDEESAKIWKEIGVPKERIMVYNAKENWWSRSGPPEAMPVGEIGGPDSEMFFEFPQITHDPKFGTECGPSCDCGRFLEIGNSVFMQYIKNKEGKLEELPHKNVDYGGGLERLTAATLDSPDVFKIDLFAEALTALETFSGKKYAADEKTTKSFRIILDHVRASVMLIREGLRPGNKQQGYVLRRLIRRSVFHIRLLAEDSLHELLEKLIMAYVSTYDYLDWSNPKEIISIIQEEADRFEKALGRGTRKLEKYLADNQKVEGKFVFDLYQTEGFPLELTLEILEEKGMKFSEAQKKAFETEFDKHKDLSRSAAAGMFKGGLADSGEETVKLHTATHLLHWALRNVLGDHVVQRGSNITAERLRFDFNHEGKLSDDELKKVEDMINDEIEKDHKVGFVILPKDEAEKTGAIHAFGEKYGDSVKVYFIGESLENAISKEFCGGPHVTATGQIGHVTITKQQKIGAGLVRIYAECA